MAKPTITKAEYHQIIGLLLLAERHDRALSEIVTALEDITGEQSGRPASGHCGDVAHGAYGKRDADELLRKLKIVVEGVSP